MSNEEEIETKIQFNEKFGFPGVVGCVDGTLMKIMAPKGDLRHLYYNRKGFYSINAMAICDCKLLIRYIDARHPGSNHDSFVWTSSAAHDYFQSQYVNGKRNIWLLGDGGYQCKPYILTPCRMPSTDIQTRYNKKMCKARNSVERCFGVLKNRFRVLHTEREMHYSPEKATKIINTCCALHNICITFKKNWPPLEDQVESFEFNDNVPEDSADGERTMDYVANHLN